MFAKTSFREMVSGVSKDSSSVAVAVETIPSVRAEKDLIIAALQGHGALLTKQLEAAMHGINQLARRIFGRSGESYHHPKQQRIDLGAVTLSRRLIRLWWFCRWLRASLLEKKCHSETQEKPIPDAMKRVHLPARKLSLEQRALADGRVLIPVGEETNKRIHFSEPQFPAFLFFACAVRNAVAVLAVEITNLSTVVFCRHRRGLFRHGHRDSNLSQGCSVVTAATSKGSLRIQESALSNSSTGSVTRLTPKNAGLPFSWIRCGLSQ